MAVTYKKLFHLMIDKNISNAELMEKAGFSANIITRLKRNHYLSCSSLFQRSAIGFCLPYFVLLGYFDTRS